MNSIFYSKLVAERTCGDIEKHVPTIEENDKGAAGMAHRTQVHAPR